VHLTTARARASASARDDPASAEDIDAASPRRGAHSSELRDDGDRAARVALIAACLATLLMCCAVAIAMAPLGTMDETAHIDYAYQIWHGKLPVFGHGLIIRPPHPALRPSVQWNRSTLR
jgi:hypothetical protein